MDYTEAQRDALKKALASGVLRVSCVGTTTEYRSVKELKAALSTVERELVADAGQDGAQTGARLCDESEHALRARTPDRSSSSKRTPAGSKADAGIWPAVISNAAKLQRVVMIRTSVFGSNAPLEGRERQFRRAAGFHGRSATSRSRLLQ